MGNKVTGQTKKKRKKKPGELYRTVHFTYWSTRVRYSTLGKGGRVSSGGGGGWAVA